MKSPIIPAALSLVYAVAALGFTCAPAPLHVLWLVCFAVSGGFAAVTASRIAQ
jgi:hypothetical protein